MAREYWDRGFIPQILPPFSRWSPREREIALRYLLEEHDAEKGWTLLRRPEPAIRAAANRNRIRDFIAGTHLDG